MGGDNRRLSVIQMDKGRVKEVSLSTCVRLDRPLTDCYTVPQLKPRLNFVVVVLWITCVPQSALFQTVGAVHHVLESVDPASVPLAQVHIRCSTFTCSHFLQWVHAPQHKDIPFFGLSKRIDGKPPLFSSSQEHCFLIQIMWCKYILLLHETAPLFDWTVLVFSAFLSYNFLVSSFTACFRFSHLNMSSAYGCVLLHSALFLKKNKTTMAKIGLRQQKYCTQTSGCHHSDYNAVYGHNGKGLHVRSL